MCNELYLNKATSKEIYYINITYSKNTYLDSLDYSRESTVNILSTCINNKTTKTATQNAWY